ncbi:hypothetical protein QJS66_11435 [Kocuria rhizophila]|nr:hypothetical protein QJS66_11435 [Kocuria rhizophila]
MFQGENEHRHRPPFPVNRHGKRQVGLGGHRNWGEQGRAPALQGRRRSVAPRVLIVGLNYSPEHTGIAPYTAGMAGRYAMPGGHRRHHTGLPHYPQRNIHEGYPKRGDGYEVIDGVPVLRAPHPGAARRRQLRRLGMEIVFGLRAATAAWGTRMLSWSSRRRLFASAIVRVRAALTRTPVVAGPRHLHTAGLSETGAAEWDGHAPTPAVEGRSCARATALVVIHDRFSEYLRRHMGVAAEQGDHRAQLDPHLRGAQRGHPPPCRRRWLGAGRRGGAAHRRRGRQRTSATWLRRAGGRGAGAPLRFVLSGRRARARS